MAKILSTHYGAQQALKELKRRREETPFGLFEIRETTLGNKPVWVVVEVEPAI